MKMALHSVKQCIRGQVKSMHILSIIQRLFENNLQTERDFGELLLQSTHTVHTVAEVSPSLVTVSFRFCMVLM
jgi:hypothetical protein